MMNNNIRRRFATVAGVGNNSTICNGLSLILLQGISEAGRHGGSTHPVCLRSETVHQIRSHIRQKFAEEEPSPTALEPRRKTAVRQGCPKWKKGLSTLGAAAMGCAPVGSGRRACVMRVAPSKAIVMESLLKGNHRACFLLWASPLFPRKKETNVFER